MIFSDGLLQSKVTEQPVVRLEQHHGDSSQFKISVLQVESFSTISCELGFISRRSCYLMTVQQPLSSLDIVGLTMVFQVCRCLQTCSY